MLNAIYGPTRNTTMHSTHVSDTFRERKRKSERGRRRESEAGREKEKETERGRETQKQ